MKKRTSFSIVKGIFLILFISVSFLAQTTDASTSYGFKNLTSGTSISGYSTLDACNAALSAVQTTPASYSNCTQGTDPSLNYTGGAATPLPILVQPSTAPNSSVSSVYNLLAPIGGLTSIQTSGGKCPSNPALANDIGCYLNLLFTLGIGLCIALSVIMIIIASVQYMGTESVFGKTEAKSQGLSALLGLFIALGAWAILNTINPDLTGANGVTVNQVTAQIDSETETAPPTTGSYTGSGSSPLCTAGYVNVNTYGSPSTINVCSSLNNIPIAANLTKMLAAAKTSNIILSGWGSRSYATQVSLRAQHGCPDPTTPSSSCTPPTARPGHSNHEVGGAVDFTCNGNSISSQSSPCFVWLSQNASTYNFINLPSEPWHWSFNGK